MDLGFWDDLKHYGASGEFAQAYVVAHELGHHVQNVLGIERKVRYAQQQIPPREMLSPSRSNCRPTASPVCGRIAPLNGDIIDQSDVKSGLDAAAAVGDDHLQKMSRGYVSPESFTHGSSANAWTGSLAA